MSSCRYLRLIVLAAVIAGTAACKTSSATGDDEPATEQATQNVEEDAEPQEQDADPVEDEEDVARKISEVDEDDEVAKNGPMVTPLDVEVDGEVDRRIVKRVFESHRGEMMFCYEQTLEEHPEAIGIVNVDFQIAPDGRVENATTDKSRLDYPDLAECVRKRVERWGFPKPAGAEPVNVRAPVAFETGEGKVPGSLDKDDIRAVIKKNRNQIRYCYEKELVNDKDLEGQVTMNWTVDKTGKVIAVKPKSSTLNNHTVEMCMSNVIRTWQFPKPDGGGIVIINYPFNFTTGD